MLPILLSLVLLGSGVSEVNMEVSNSAIKILKELEKLKLEAYRDGSSISIGYGHSNSSGGEQFKMGDTITEEKAEELLVKDLEEIQRIVNQRLSNYDITFNQNQFDVMIIGTYNRPGKLSSKKYYEALLLDNPDEVEKIWNTSITDKDRQNFPGLIDRLNVELSALEPDRGIPVPEEGFDPSPVPSTTTTTTVPMDNGNMDIESRSAGITNMFGSPPQDNKTQTDMSERKQKINNVFTKLFTSMVGSE
jgi:GH24 family phage-related lysozyme (muramidase)